MKQLLRGPALKLGDAVGVVAPASGFNEDKLRDGIARCQQMGYRVVEGMHLHDRSGQYFAGTAAQRAEDIHAMFRDPAIKALICARGGYGSASVLSLLDLDAIRENPKPILGCSDISALQLWLLDQTGLAGLHGPMMAGDFSRVEGLDMASLEHCFAGDSTWSVAADEGLRTIFPGQAAGRLWGGCLSLLVSMLGTPHELLRNADEDIVLFIEDVGEKPYQIERMLEQWQAAGKLAKVRGIVFGEMLYCDQPSAHYTLEEVLRRVLAGFQGPVAIGLRSGHVSRGNVTLPLGVHATLEAGADGRAGATALLRIDEPALLAETP
jgi:muramoyltetrapeptide carboxypeptidase